MGMPPYSTLDAVFYRVFWGTCHAPSSTRFVLQLLDNLDAEVDEGPDFGRRMLA
jgi:hypothetical protein